jgi:sulfur carrier protein ThiS
MDDHTDSATPAAPEETELRLAGSLADLAPGRATQRVSPGQTILQAAVTMGVPAHQRFLSSVNGQVCPADYVLRPGDRAVLFPPIAGGRL